MKSVERADPGPLAGLLRELRQRATLTQEELAAKAGLSIGTVRGVEAGRIRRPRAASLRLLADALHLTDHDRTALAQAAGARAGDRAAASPPVPGPVPAQLPPDVRGFTGRAEELHWMSSLLRNRRQGVPVLIAVDGLAGVGKTALAIHWAHRIRARFPDGQLYLNLRGHAPGQAALTPIEALSRLLQSLGVRAEDVPPDAASAAGLFRSYLADRRVALVLDDAGDVDQVRSLLPGGSECVVVVTSRERLDGLVALDGAYRLGLDVLSPGDARSLLSAMLGADRVCGEASAADELRRLCGHLPLALRIAAANLALQPEGTIGAYVRRLQEGDPLAGLVTAGDPEGAVAVAFGLSYARLSDAGRRTFRLLSLVPGPDVTAEATAALAATTSAHAASVLTDLARAHLLEEHAPGRYGWHDLLKTYAFDRARREESPTARTTATARLLGWYLRTADAAASLLHPQAVLLGGGEPGGRGGPRVRFRVASDATDWLDAERANLVAAASHAAVHGPRPVAWLLADRLRGRLWRSGDPPSWRAIGMAALLAARNELDAPGEATALLNLGDLHQRHGSYSEALELYNTALASANEADWAEGEAVVLNNIAMVEMALGRLEEAASTFSRALEVNQRLRRPAQQGTNLGNLGVVHLELGDLRAATRYQAQALRLHRGVGLAQYEAMDLCNLGHALRDLGHLYLATQALSRAVALSREIGYLYPEAGATWLLSSVHDEAGRHDEARELASTAVRLATEITDRQVLADAWNAHGAAHLHLGEPESAYASHARALDVARRAADLGREIDALLGLSVCDIALHRDVEAATGANAALRLSRDHAHRVREGRALSTLACVNLHRGDHDAAVTGARAALELQRQTGHRLGEARTRQILAAAFERAGAWRLAGEERTRAMTLFGSCGAALPVRWHSGYEPDGELTLS